MPEPLNQPRIIPWRGFRKLGGRPLRAVILDNDETTGFYIALEFLINSAIQRGLPFEHAVSFIHDQLNTINAFRPGLYEFLRYILYLRQSGSIDAIIMYTNMVPGRCIRGPGPACYPNADILAAVFDRIVGTKFFNLLIVRSGTLKPEKYIDFVLSVYNANKNDMSKIVFFDDRPSYILYKRGPKPPHIYGIDAYTWWRKKRYPSTMRREIEYLNTIYE